MGMERRRKRPHLLLVTVACSVLTGCATVLPNTARAIEPQGATLDDVGLALIADVEMLLEQLGWIWAILFGV